MLPDFITIVHSPLPISPAAPTHYVSFLKHIFLYFFKTFLGPFRGLSPLFSNSPSPATYPHIFSDVSIKHSCFLLHGTTKGLNCRVQRSCRAEAILPRKLLIFFPRELLIFFFRRTDNFPDSFFRVIYSFFKLSP